MSVEANKTTVRRWIAAFNQRNVAILDEFIAPDFVYHTRRQRGLDSLKKSYAMLYRGFPDIHATIEDIIAEGDKVWVLVKVMGTHTGEYFGLSPTGKKFTITSVDIRRIIDGKIVEGWDAEDVLDFYKQLDVIEYTARARELFPEDVI